MVKNIETTLFIPKLYAIKQRYCVFNEKSVATTQISLTAHTASYPCSPKPFYSPAIPIYMG